MPRASCVDFDRAPRREGQKTARVPSPLPRQGEWTRATAGRPRTPDPDVDGRQVTVLEGASKAMKGEAIAECPWDVISVAQLDGRCLGGPRAAARAVRTAKVKEVTR